MIRVIIAEDHQVVRNGIRLILADDPAIQVVLETDNGIQVLKTLDGGLEADLILSDMNMPLMDGMKLLKAVKERYPRICVLFLSMFTDPKMVLDAIHQGAGGYLYKNSDAMELIFAIKFVHAGSTYLGAELALNLLHSSSMAKQKFVPAELDIKLTDREISILVLISEGLTNHQIADRLFLSKRTVEGHRLEMLKKTGAINSASMIRIAIQKNIL